MDMPFSQLQVWLCNAPKWVKCNKTHLSLSEYLHNETSNAEFFYLPCKGKTKAQRQILKLDQCGLTSVFVYSKNYQLLEQLSKGCDRLSDTGKTKNTDGIFH